MGHARADIFRRHYMHQTVKVDTQSAYLGTVNVTPDTLCSIRTERFIHTKCNAARPRVVYSRVAKPPPLLYIDYQGVKLPPVATILLTHHKVPYSTPGLFSHIPFLS